MQHQAHPTWSYLLHADHLVAHTELGDLEGHAPSYTTVRRLMKERGLFRQKRRQRRGNQDVTAHDHSREIFEARETRSYESAYVHGLWHLDFHGAKFVRIVLPNGQIVTPKPRGIDNSGAVLAPLDPLDRTKNGTQSFGGGKVRKDRAGYALVG